jgi:broad specificity phosphatase PhoE
MKIFILRHEDRTMDGTFFSPLTQDGLENSIKLIDLLNKCNIDYIYSSPFIRTLQTIYPYSKSKGIKINPDHSLSEIQHPHIIPVKSYQINLPLYIAEQFNCNTSYTSILDPLYHMYPEDDKNVHNRVKNFITRLVSEKIETKYNIIIVTHQVVCNSLLKLSTKKIKDIKIDSAYNYPRGGLTKIFDTNEWLFQPLNWKYIPSNEIS